MRVEAGKSGSDPTGSGALLVGGLASILASTCCLGPLVLVALGLSGAWIGDLTLVEPYRPLFLVTFDDAKTNTDALVKATTNAGFPSQPEKAAK